MAHLDSTQAGTSAFRFDASNAQMNTHGNVGCGNVVGDNNHVETHILSSRVDIWDDIMNKWLLMLALDCMPIHEQVYSNRVKNTGGWFINHVTYQRWVKGEEKHLACTGIPGAGKTSIASAIVEDLRQKSHSHSSVWLILYIYCRHDKESSQTIPAILLGLLYQTIEQRGYISRAVRDLHGKHSPRHGLLPSGDRIIQVLQSEAKAFERTYIVLDALDEYRVKDYSSAQELVEQLQRLNAQLLITSRHKVNFTPSTRFATIQISADAEDIRIYIQSQRGNLVDVAGRADGLLEKIIEVIIVKSEGMFMIAKLLIDCLCEALTPREIHEGLRNLPTGLEDTYELTLHRIRRQKPRLAQLAMKAFGWVTFAKRRLTPLELIHAISFQSGDRITKDDLIGENTLLSACGGLLSFVTTGSSKEEICQFSHFTTEEFLKKHLEHYLPDAERLIAETCLEYLTMAIADFPLQSIIGDRNRQDAVDYARRFVALPLCKYAVLHWPQHAENLRQTLKDGIFRDFTKHALSPYLAEMWRISTYGSRVQFCATFGAFRWVEEFSIDSREPLIGDRHLQITTLDRHLSTGIVHHAAMGALLNPCSGILLSDTTTQTGPAPAATGSIVDVLNIHLSQKRGILNKNILLSHIPFSFVVTNGLSEILIHMLNIGLDKVEDIIKQRTLLPSAARAGHLGVAKILLKHGVDSNSRDHLDRTALDYAAREGHLEMVKILLEHNVDMNSRDLSCRSPLFLAAEAGHLEVVKLLLKHGAYINSRSSWGSTPLSTAASLGYLEVAKILLEHGANLHPRDVLDRTPLSLAVRMGHSEIASHLREHGAKY